VFGTRYERVVRPQHLKYSESSAVNFWIGSDYFKAMGIPLLRGRAFTDADRLQAPPGLIINETKARRVFPDENALGKRMKLSADYPEVTRRIIGVVRAIRRFGLEEG